MWVMTRKKEIVAKFISFAPAPSTCKRTLRSHHYLFVKCRRVRSLLYPVRYARKEEHINPSKFCQSSFVPFALFPARPGQRRRGKRCKMKHNASAG